MFNGGKIRKYLNDGGYKTNEINYLLRNSESEKAFQAVAEQAFMDGGKVLASRIVKLILQFGTAHKPPECPGPKPEETPTNPPQETPEKPLNCGEAQLISWYCGQIMRELGFE